jgi:hypothetical protein
VLKNRTFQAMTILVVVITLLVMIVLVVLVTQNGSKASTTLSATPTLQQGDTDTASEQFVEDLKPLLSNESLNALLNP